MGDTRSWIADTVTEAQGRASREQPPWLAQNSYSHAPGGGASGPGPHGVAAYAVPAPEQPHAMPQYPHHGYEHPQYQQQTWSAAPQQAPPPYGGSHLGPGPQAMAPPPPPRPPYAASPSHGVTGAQYAPGGYAPGPYAAPAGAAQGPHAAPPPPPPPPPLPPTQHQQQYYSQAASQPASLPPSYQQQQQQQPPPPPPPAGQPGLPPAGASPEWENEPTMSPIHGEGASQGGSHEAGRAASARPDQGKLAERSVGDMLSAFTERCLQACEVAGRDKKDASSAVRNTVARFLAERGSLSSVDWDQVPVPAELTAPKEAAPRAAPPPPPGGATAAVPPSHFAQADAPSAPRRAATEEDALRRYERELELQLERETRVGAPRQTPAGGAGRGRYGAAPAGGGGRYGPAAGGGGKYGPASGGGGAWEDPPREGGRKETQQRRGKKKRERATGAEGASSKYGPGVIGGGRADAGDPALKRRNRDRFEEAPRRKRERRSPQAHDRWGGVQKVFLGADEDAELFRISVKGRCTSLEKPYFRLTDAPNPDDVRPPEVLARALERLLRMWQSKREAIVNAAKHSEDAAPRREQLPADANPLEAFNMSLKQEDTSYNYLCSQLKAIRQDLKVQRVNNELAVRVYEEHARIALQCGDMDNYNQCQSQLLLLYRSGVPGCIGEFTAYRILYFVSVIVVQGVQTVAQDLLRSLGEIVSLMEGARRLPGVVGVENAAVRHALLVRKAVFNDDHCTFFKLVGSAPMLGPLLLAPLVERIRVKALQATVSAYKPAVKLPLLCRILGFAEDEGAACTAFLARCGLALEGAPGEERLSTRNAVVAVPA